MSVNEDELNILRDSLEAEAITIQEKLEKIYKTKEVLDSIQVGSKYLGTETIIPDSYRETVYNDCRPIARALLGLE